MRKRLCLFALVLLLLPLWAGTAFAAPSEAPETPAVTSSAQDADVQTTRKPVTIQGTREFVDENPWAQTLINIAAILLITYLAAYVVKRLWQRNRKNSQFLFRKYVYYIIRVCIYVVGVLCAVGQIPLLSQVVQTILAGSGILALAVSLSAQESLNNLISGMFITLFRPFEVGDRVMLVGSNITGTIEDITLRHTIIRTFTNTRLVVPNSTVNKETLENYNIMDARGAAFIDVTVAYESDLDLAMELMAEVIGNHPQYLDVRTDEEKQTAPKVAVYVRELGSSGVELRATMWTQTVGENYAACCEVRRLLKMAFDQAGIEIPYTKYTILHQDS